MNKLRKQAQSGFTMVEVALAILVVAVGLLGVFALFPVGLHAGRDAVDDTEVMMVAEAVLSNLHSFMATNYNDTASGFVFDYNGTDIRPGSTSELMRPDNFTPLCTVQLRVRPRRAGSLAEANLICYPGKTRTRTIEFYTRCARRAP